ncbi:O-methyltransferase [Mycobacterium sp.]|jgi:catechol O-methyltransferase|uniref:O-methyltransferase n=1 Tax=Mycobacterium sp. TaxID=1785 RepID=UPI002D38A9B4|nr:class I SAM-dependent methyltransferase [Mycobacterium sp.]HZA11514.1 class I SAM-dependent methyltransferase [Mycobacterium sp.]
MTLKQRMPLVRLSYLRFLVGARHFIKTGQVGDGRECVLADHVVSKARKGDIGDVLATIDKFAYEQMFLVNIGDQKGKLLDAAVKRADPKLILELGTYVGYSALRLLRDAPSAKVVSVEMCAANAEVAGRIWAHAGVDDRIISIVGTIDDGGPTLVALAAEGIGTGRLDFLFLDHDKNAYLPDLRTIVDEGWLHPGSIVVADNVGFPGAPKYRAYMREQQNNRFDTVEHNAHSEYQTWVRDLVLESEFLG